jgi:hypothetical protein
VVDGIDVVSRPSLATRGTPQDGALLVVYGKGNQVVGRLLRFSRRRPESQFGPAFAIMDVPSSRAVFSTDVIYNQHSERFIVGENRPLLRARLPDPERSGRRRREPVRPRSSA